MLSGGRRFRGFLVYMEASLGHYKFWFGMKRLVTYKQKRGEGKYLDTVRRQIIGEDLFCKIGKLINFAKISRMK